MPEILPHETSYLRDALLFLLAAVVIVPIFRQLRVNPVLGYLIAGGAIGPYGLALVSNVGETHRLAEFGIVFMLFTIGLELSLDRLKTMARYVFGFGSLQVAFSGLALGVGAAFLGVSWAQAAVIGGALALSSTAFVLQILSDRAELPTRLGRVALSILLLQDLAVVPGIAVVTALGGEPESLAQALTVAALKAVVALAVLLVAGRLVLRPLYRMIAGTRSPELFAAATLLVVLGTAWGTAQAGLSMPLGAFLAGLMLAGTEFRHQIEADIRPVRGILLGLFFLSVGMLIDLRLVAAELPRIAALVAALILLKAAIVVALGRIFGLAMPLAVSLGLHLAQGGEFAFVLFSLAMGTAVLPLETGQLLLGVVAVSLALTPFLATAGQRAQRLLERRGLGSTDMTGTETQDITDHVIIAGFGRVGRTIARLLDAQGQRWLAVDLDAANVAAWRRLGLPVFFGDAGGHAVFRAVGAERARAAVITMDDAKAAAAAVGALRQNLPDLPIIVRAHDHQHLDEFAAAGVTHVIPEMTEASLLLGGAVLRTLGMSDDQVASAIAPFRRNAYAQLGDIGASAKETRSAPAVAAGADDPTRHSPAPPTD